MTGKNLADASKNVNNARDELLEHFGYGEYFQPEQDEFLYKWLSDGLGYSGGRRLQADIWEMNDGNRQDQLRTDVVWKLCHIFFTFNEPIHIIAAKWAVFYALIMGRAITKAFFASSQAIWNNVAQLAYIDKAEHREKFGDAITRLSKYGFCRYFYLSLDDSKHFKRNRHVLIMTTFEDCDEDWASADFVIPTCRLVTSAVNMVSSSNAQTQMNADALIEDVGLRIAAHAGGACTDNASGALNESHQTFDLIMDACRASDDDEIRQMPIINGVVRRPIIFGDPFHWANLAVMHASLGMAGDTDNGEHEQVHHRQCLMSMHSLHSDDAGYSQTVMDRVMHGQKRVAIRTWRERQQRWLVNQRYARKVLAMLACSTGFGVVCLVAWALYFANNSRSSWKSRVGKEVATWLSKPEIVLGLHYEAELGDYFEEIMAWHNRTGPNNSRSGFRIMEIHDLYFKYEISWWNQVNENPRTHMPKTMMEYPETKVTTSRCA